MLIWKDVLLDQFVGGYMAQEERLKELELEYKEFVKTDSGKIWSDDCKSRS